MFDFDGLTADGKVQAIAAVLSTVLTIVAALGAAWWGAKSGAESTQEAAILSLRTAIEAERLERLHVQREALNALASEFRLNAELVDQSQVLWLRTKLQAAAIEDARRYVHVLPHAVNLEVQDASFRVFRFNALADAASDFPSDAGRIQDELKSIGKDAQPVFRRAAHMILDFLDETSTERAT